MSKFNTKLSNHVMNLAGGDAFSHSTKMELIISCLSTFLENKFYESGDERMERIKKLIALVPHEFTAKLAIMARSQFYLRSVSHFLVAELAKIHKGDDLVRRTILKIAERPDDLSEIAAQFISLPKQVKRGIRRAIFRFSPYQLAKYRGEEKKVSLVDLFNLVHPNPKFASVTQKTSWKNLIEGKLKNEETWEARLSSGEDKKKVWKDLITKRKIGYMALLRNLRNISEQADGKTKKAACKIISDKDEVRKSKQLPFRFYNAYENVSDKEMLETISKAMEHSLDNVPKFEGDTLIGIDTSGSMRGDPIKKASVFAAALMRANNADVILYDTNIKKFKSLRVVPVLTIAEKIQTEAMGGGTDTSLVFQYAILKQIKYHRIIIISDNESWADNVQSYYQEYKKLADPTVYAIDIAGYGTKDVSGGKIYHIVGWGEQIFEFMKWIEKENQLIDFVEKIEI